MKVITKTDNNLSGLILRVALAVAIFPHGAQKMLGWFGGNGYSATMTYFTETMGIPWALAFLAILAEFLGSIGLFFGLLTRVAALGIGTVMVVAAVMVHWKHGFFMNWFGSQEGEGFEYHILAAAIALALVIRGGGFLSLDRELSVKKKK